MNRDSAAAVAQGRQGGTGPAGGGAPAAPMAGGPVGTRRFTRDDVVRLGQTGKPWEFVPVAMAALRAAPGDGAVRFLFAAALGKLGLRTLALEQVGLIGGQAAGDPAVGQLREALAGLPADEIKADRRRAVLAGNLEALGARGIDLARPAASWIERVGGEQAYQATDGNVVRRPAGAREPWAWLHLADHAGAAGAFVSQQVAGRAGQQLPVTLEGLDPPWLFAGVARAMPREATGFQARVVAVQADPMEALDGLSIADVREELRAERVMVFAGRDASVRYGDWLRGNLEKRFNGPVVPLATLRMRVEPGVAEVLQAGVREQEAASETLKARVLERDAGRGAAWVAERFKSALTTETQRHAGGGERRERIGDSRLIGTGRPEQRPVASEEGPLRVLIPTCRYTTFLQHAARDLADGFERIGCAAEVLIEPDGQSQMSSVAYLGAIERVDPDLIVFLNYARRQFGTLLPPGVPVACWVQDVMPHLFRAETGAAQGPLDFIVGHCGEELFTRYGFSRERAIGCPVVASDRKFHAGPVGDELRERFGCEIACVTHHSETVQAMHARLLGEVSDDPEAAGVLAELLPVCLDVAGRAHRESPWGALMSGVRDAMRGRHRRAGDPDLEGIFLRNYAVQVADRAFRHLALEWGARAARRRGWRLRIYGKGWEKHPTLAGFAAGLTEHGEELRAAYQCAAVNLHLCLSTLMHQRPMECALSGGLPVVRPTRDVLSSLRTRAQERLAERGASPVGVDEESGLPLYSFVDAPEGMRLASLAQRLGMAERPGLLLTEQKLEAIRRRRAVEPIETDAAWLFGDLAEVSFVDEEGLERLVERAIDRPEWRGDVSRGIAGRVRERLTHTALARRMVEGIGKRAREVAGAEAASGVKGHA